MEIPGFYYDPEKKKYFKDGPERKKIKLEMIPKQASKTSIFSFLKQQELGSKNRFHLNYSLQKSIKIHDFSSISDYTIRDNFGCFGFNSGEFLVAGLNFDESKVTFIQTFAKETSVTRVCTNELATHYFVSFLGQGVDSGHVNLYYTPDSRPDTLSLIKEIQPLSSKPIWYCDVLPDCSKLLVGSFQCYYLYDLVTMQHSLHHIPSDCLYQKWKDGNTYFNGCRNGKLYMSDVRVRTRPMYFKTPCSISSIEIDMFNIISFSIDGTVQLWDVRKPFKPIQETKFENRGQKMSSSFAGKNQVVFGTDVGWLHFLDINTWSITYQKKWNQVGDEGCVVKQRDCSFDVGHLGFLDTWSF
jgi:hypothetical protein